MSLNDPFGRLQRRDDDAYDRLRRQLRDAGILDREGVQDLLRRTRQRVLGFSLIVLCATLGLLVLLPELAPISVALGILLLAFALGSLLKGQRLLRRWQAELAVMGNPARPPEEPAQPPAADPAPHRGR